MKIRLNTIQLLGTSTHLLKNSVVIKGVGSTLYRVGRSAPSYDGQFGPKVRTICNEAVSLSNKNSDLINSLAVRIAKKGVDFLSVDSSFGNTIRTILNSLFGSKGSVKGISVSKSTQDLLNRYLWLGGLTSVAMIPIGYAGLVYKLNLIKSGTITGQAAATKRDLIKPSSPLKDWTPSGDFGWYTIGVKRLHQGADLIPKNNSDWSVHPIRPGKVIATGFDAKGYGNYVVVEHALSDGVTKIHSRYAHLATPTTVMQNAKVTAATSLGQMGDSGSAKGQAHLHLEVYASTARNQNFYGITESNASYEST